jgi:streptomycin 6-kinase
MTDAPFYLPDSLMQNRSSMGPESTAYLERLPALVAQYREQWQLQLEPPFPRLSYNYAAPATLPDGTHAVLKVCVPDREFRAEAHALQLFAGEGAVRLLAANVADGVLLLERLEPGVPIIDLEADDEATEIALSTMQRLPSALPSSHPFPSLAGWFEGFDRHRASYGGSGPLPAGLLDRAEALVRDLLESSPTPVLLHGDLNYGNVLSAQRDGWLAIDPKGVTGDAVFDTAILLHDPVDRILDAPSPQRFLARRVDQIVEQSGFPRERVLGWGIAYAVLSAVWSAEDHGGGWEGAITCAEVLETL